MLIAGYPFDPGKSLFEPLHRSMIEHGLTYRCSSTSSGSVMAHRRRFTLVKRSRTSYWANWPAGNNPTRASTTTRERWNPTPTANLHAKCVVVDECRTLIGLSANFTDRGRTRNVEVGVLIDDAAFASRLVQQWRGLVEAGLLVRG